MFANGRLILWVFFDEEVCMVELESYLRSSQELAAICAFGNCELLLLLSLLLLLLALRSYNYSERFWLLVCWSCWEDVVDGVTMLSIAEPVLAYDYNDYYDCGYCGLICDYTELDVVSL